MAGMKTEFDLIKAGKGLDFPMKKSRVYPDLLTVVLSSLLPCRNDLKYA